MTIMLINIKEPLLWPSSLLNSLHTVLSLTEVFTYCNYRISFTLRLYSSLIGLSFNPTGRFKVGWWHLTQVQYHSISGLLISYIPFLLSKFWNCPATAQGSSLSYRFSLSPSIFFSYSASSFFYFCVAVDTVGNIFLLINSFLAFIEPVLFLVFSLLSRPFFFFSLFDKLLWPVFSLFSLCRWQHPYVLTTLPVLLQENLGLKIKWSIYFLWVHVHQERDFLPFKILSFSLIIKT